MDGTLELTLAAVFLAGLSGGVHCAAMCGPLIGIACGPSGSGAGGDWLAQSLAYNAGRVASYVAAGALAAGVGAAGLAARGTPLAQHALMAATSLTLILMAAYVAGFAPFVRVVERAGALLWRRIAPRARHFLPASTPSRAFGLGLVFGWLPCGMVYLALLSALATADAVEGGLVMAAFGLGTLPNLLAISASLKSVVGRVRGRAQRLAVAGLIAALGVFGMARASLPGVAPEAGGGGFSAPAAALLHHRGH